MERMKPWEQAWLALRLAEMSCNCKSGFRPDGIIEDAKFKTFGCGSAIASSSLLTEWVKGKSLEEANQIKNTELAQELSLPPGKNPL